MNFANQTFLLFLSVVFATAWMPRPNFNLRWRLVALILLFCLMPVNYFLGYFPMDGKSTVIQVVDFNGTIG